MLGVGCGIPWVVSCQLSVQGPVFIPRVVLSKFVVVEVALGHFCVQLAITLPLFSLSPCSVPYSECTFLA